MADNAPHFYASDMTMYGRTADNWDPAGETWTEVSGVFSFELHRASGGASSWVELRVAGSTLPWEYQQRILVARQSITIAGKVLTGLSIVGVNVDFVGRVDEITPYRDEQYGQSWKVRCRDYLGVLQDNYVQREGRNRYVRSLGLTFGSRLLDPNTGVTYTTSASDQADFWGPNWANGAGKYDPPTQSTSRPAQPGGNPGSIAFYRALIAAEMAMNFVDLPAGIRAVDISQVPLATVSGGAALGKDVPSYAVDTNSNKTIADAMHEVLQDDPWIVSGAQPIGATTYPNADQGSGVQHSYTTNDLLKADGVSSIPGIGTEMLADYNPPLGRSMVGTSSTTPTPGVGSVTYKNVVLPYAAPYIRIFARGVINFDTAVQFWYGASDTTGGVLRYPILEYNFPKEGGSLFSRAKTVGKGESSAHMIPWPHTFMKTASINGGGAGAGSFRPVSPDYSGGAGAYVWDNDDEVVWDPLNNRYASIRTGASNDDGLSGYGAIDGTQNADGTYTAQGGNENILLRDIKQMANPNSLRSLQRGTITVPGLPRNSAGYPLITGVVIGVNIPPLFAADVAKPTFFVVDSYVYTWPENKTTINLARRPYDEMGDALRSMRSFSLAAASQGKSTYDSGYVLSSSGGSTTFQHNWGSRPTVMLITCAGWDGTTRDQNGNPKPIPGSEVELPAAAYDPQNGVWVGGVVTGATATMVTVSYVGNMAPSSNADGQGQASSARWLTAGSALVRLQIRG